MTENGVLIPKDGIEEIHKYTMTYIDPSMNDDILLDYRELIAEGETQILKKTIDYFLETWTDIPLDKIIYLKRENEIHIVFKNKVRILFTLQDFAKKTGESENYDHLRMQILSLKTFIDTYKEDLLQSKFIYIDARIPGKIFSCRDKNICTKNLTTIYPDINL